MDFALTPRCEEYREKLLAFMDEKVYPAEPVFEAELEASGNPHAHTKVMEDLKAEARKRGLWNLFHPHKEWGPGLTNAEYAPLAEIMGRSFIAPEACNCNAPDTGNMEVLTMFGTPEQQDMWLRPLLEGKIRSAFAMTEPAVASSDATNISLRIERDGDYYVLNGVKWWTSNGLHPLTKILIVMGKTDPNAAPHQQQSQILVPIDTPGLTIKRNLKVFGFIDHEGHSETVFDNVRVPASNLIANEGDGFMISQARLGPGRIHHCMRTIGAAERALEMMCTRALSRTTFGKRVAERSNIQDWIAEARIELDAYPNHEIPGEVSYISPVIIPNMDLSRTFTVRVKIKGEAEKFVVGMSASTTIIAQRKEGVVKAPAEALVREKTAAFVFTFADGKVSRVPVKVGFTDGPVVEILEGLADNARVALPGKTKLA